MNVILVNGCDLVDQTEVTSQQIRYMSGLGSRTKESCVTNQICVIQTVMKDQMLVIRVKKSNHFSLPSEHHQNVSSCSHLLSGGRL